jgi:acetyl esterase/lipase
LALGSSLVLSSCSCPSNKLATTSPGTASSELARERPYLERRAGFQTHLTRSGPAPQAYDEVNPPPGVEAITYRSGSLALRAWLAFPREAVSGARVPAVAYLHGGFAFGDADFEDARAFLDAGFAVMCPTLRGENGNPGAFEMFLGEVDDAKAAIAWLSQNEKVDPAHLYVFGHSAGGIVSALLSLHADVPIRHSGSVGGLYGHALFDLMAEIVPFSQQAAAERSLRVLLGNTRWMRRAHHAYVGSEDPHQEMAAAIAEGRAQPLLRVRTVSGDHQTSLAPAVRAYLQTIRDAP